MHTIYPDFGYQPIFSFNSFQILFFIVFIIIAIIILYHVFSSIGENIKNSSLPILTVDSNVLTKRVEVSGHKHSYTEYYITFEFENGDRIELKIPSKEYGMIAEGDKGYLSFQGTKYKSFKRKKNPLSIS